MRSKWRLAIIFASLTMVVLISSAFKVNVCANMIYPSNPATTPAGAWEFNNALDVTNRFLVSSSSHFYRLNVSGTLNYEVIFTSPAGNTSTVIIRNAGQGVVETITSSGGVHVADIILGAGTFYIEVQYAPILADENYRLQMNPATPVEGDFITSPRGERIEVRHRRMIGGQEFGYIYVEGVRMTPMNYEMWWNQRHGNSWADFLVTSGPSNDAFLVRADV